MNTPSLVAIILLMVISTCCSAEVPGGGIQESVQTEKYMSDGTAVNTVSIPFKQDRENGWLYFKVTLVLLIMLGLAYAMVYAIKVVNKQKGGITSGEKRIKVVETRKLDTTTKVHLVSVDLEVFLIAQNGHSIKVVPVHKREPIQGPAND